MDSLYSESIHEHDVVSEGPVHIKINLFNFCGVDLGLFDHSLWGKKEPVLFHYKTKHSFVTYPLCIKLTLFIYLLTLFVSSQRPENDYDNYFMAIHLSTQMYCCIFI